MSRTAFGRITYNCIAYAVIVVNSALCNSRSQRENGRDHLRRGHAIKNEKPKKPPTGIKITKAIRKDPPDVEKIVAGLVELVLELSRKVPK